MRKEIGIEGRYSGGRGMVRGEDVRVFFFQAEDGIRDRFT